MKLAARLINETQFNGLYVNCKLTDQSNTELFNYLKNNLKDFPLTPPTEYHTTIIYGRDTVMSYAKAQIVASNPSTSREPITGYVEKLAYWDGHDKTGYLVAIIQSPALKAIHEKWIAAGARHSFEDYTPHITIAQELPDPFKVDNLKIVMKNINLYLRRNELGITFKSEEFTEIRQ